MDGQYTVEAYMGRLADLAQDADHIQRFYLFIDDEQLYDMEYELSNSNASKDFYRTLLARYQVWKDEMGPDKWREVIARNHNLNGANRNALVDELED